MISIFGVSYFALLYFFKNLNPVIIFFEFLCILSTWTYASSRCLNSSFWHNCLSTSWNSTLRPSTSLRRWSYPCVWFQIFSKRLLVFIRWACVKMLLFILGDSMSSSFLHPKWSLVTSSCFLMRLIFSKLWRVKWFLKYVWSPKIFIIILLRNVLNVIILVINHTRSVKLGWKIILLFT